MTIISTGIDYKKWFVDGVKSHVTDGNILISDHVWIGAGATILNGVKITGNYVVVAANSTVCKDITESHCIVAGTPAKVISRIDL